jgi:soluble lytic murein transglycosylase
MLKIMTHKKSFLIVFGVVFLGISCNSSNKLTQSIAAEMSHEGQDKKWIASYKEVQKSCKAFKEFLNESAPSDEIKAVSQLRYKQKCLKSENLLSDLKYDWLKKDAIFSGIRTTENPKLFANYYEAYLNLGAQDRMGLEFLERAGIYRKILKRVNQKTEKELFEKLLSMFPSFYVEYGKAVPEAKLFEAAYGLRMQGKLAESRKIYAKLISSAKASLVKQTTIAGKKQKLDEIHKAEGFVRITYRIENKKEIGINESKKAVTFFENYFTKNPRKEFSSHFTDTAVQLARDIWTEGRVTEARKILNNVATKKPRVASLDQVYWVLGRMDQEKENFAGAISYFEKALKENPDNNFRLKLMWLVAWNAKKNNQLDKAIQGLEQLEKTSKQFLDESNYSKSLFWQAKIYREQNNEKKAKELLEKVSNENVFGYYGRLAKLEINPGFFETELADSVVIDQNDLKTPERERVVRNLTSMDELGVLAEYIGHLWKAIGKSARKKLATRLQYLSWSHDSELFKENQQNIEIFDKDSKIEMFEKAPFFFYPRPYYDITQTQTQKFNVAEEIVYSIMRQESLFDRKARSPADAFGLLQLLPSVAKRHMEEAGVSFTHPEELYEPTIILPLGIVHLSHLQRLFNQSMLLAAASYNAGTGPVKNWLKTRYKGDSFEFIEDIPYAETETYTKLVFRNLSFYVQFNKDLDAKKKPDLLKSYFKIKTSK